MFAGNSLAATPQPLGFHNAPKGGVRPERLKLVHGRAPTNLSGTLYRNGPALFQRGDTILNHWFDGDGLVRSFTLNGGEATLAARFVETIKRKHDSAAGQFIMPGFGSRAAENAPVTAPDDANAANTSVLSVGDALWALWEVGSPYAIDPKDLSTIGPVTLRPDLAQMPFSAHPKVEADGTIWNFGMAYGSPKTFVWALAPDGTVLKTGIIDLPMAAYLHDWVVSRTKLIFPLQPWLFTDRFGPYVKRLDWQPDVGMKVLVVNKDDFSKGEVYDLPGEAYFHTGSVIEETDGTIRFDICLSDRPTVDAHLGSAILRGTRVETPQSVLKQITLMPSGRSRVVSSDIPAEFPTTPKGEDYKADRLVFFASEGKETSATAHRFNAVGSMDWQKEKTDIFDFGRDTLVEEPIHVPNDGGPGYLLVPALSVKEESTFLHLFDASRIKAGPIASWQSKHPLPISLHGTWHAGA